MKGRAIAVAIGLLTAGSVALTSCHSTGTAFNPPGGLRGGQHVYWDMFSATPAPAGTPEPQVEFAGLRLHAGAAVTALNGSGANMLDFASNMLIDSQGRLWVLSFPPTSPVETAEIFKLPLTAASTPAVTLTFTGRDCFCGAITFDKSGNLWGVEHDGDLFEYTGPFTVSGSISPAIEHLNAVNSGASISPTGIAVDASGNVYVSNGPSAGTNSIAVFTAPVTSASTPAYYLDGVSNASALIFDAQGNLYAGSYHGPACASNCITATIGIARFDSNNLASGAVPNVVDSTGMAAIDPNPYEAEFAFDKAGDLYDADCGNAGAIFVYPSVATSFSSSEAPSITFTDTAMANAGCTWGIAVH